MFNNLFLFIYLSVILQCTLFMFQKIREWTLWVVVYAAYIQFSGIVYAVNEAKNDVTNLIKQNLVICGLYIKYAL